MAFTQKAIGKTAGLMWRFFYNVPSVLSFSPAPLRVVSGPIRATRVRSPWISFFIYTHPHAAAKIALPQFSVSSFLVADWVGQLWVPEKADGQLLQKKKKKVGDSGSLLASSQLCKRKLCRSLPWTSSRIRMRNSCQRVGKSISVQTRVKLDWMYVSETSLPLKGRRVLLPCWELSSSSNASLVCHIFAGASDKAK